MKNPKILVICVTNFVYSVILAQDRNCGYLLDLASENRIEIAIPEFSFLEVRGRIGGEVEEREISEEVRVANDFVVIENVKAGVCIE